MGVASEVLFNQNIALAYLEDQNKWAIVGSEDYLGLNATIIKGELPAYFKDKHNAETFKLWVHEETGILLKMEEYNQNGEVVYYVETHSIKLNSPLESEKFITKDKPAGYSEDK